ncbi:relaxase/mobilization nuclease domain-containing protein [Rhodobacter sp. NSM]|uniref:relaxase/mobilization nuclease domain-containing protein n=1 Tax=Rhodobacter sp. NSM TaxID=3457501 RepID=UPI003FD30EDC
MTDFETFGGFEDCWPQYRASRKVKARTSGVTGSGRLAGRRGGEGGKILPADPGPVSKGATLSPDDKSRLARVVRRAPEVVVKVSVAAKHDKQGNPIHVNRSTEAVRVAAHLSYISRNGKLELENDRGEVAAGRSAAAAVFREWVDKHDEDRANGMASDRTRITTSMVFSMPGHASPEVVRDAVRALAGQEFQGRHDYVMALHTDTHHPHVHLTVRTVGHDGAKLALRKADLQHLRDVFAQQLRQRGVEAESTPRHARGVPRRGEATPVYKIRQRGGKPMADSRTRREVEAELAKNSGRLRDQPWDDAILRRRGRVMAAYAAAAATLARSSDPADQALARETEQFAARLTDTETRRAAMALSIRPVEREAAPTSNRSLSASRQPSRREERDENGRDRQR